jgi:hypothetical protein
LRAEIQLIKKIPKNHRAQKKMTNPKKNRVATKTKKTMMVAVEIAIIPLVIVQFQ